MIRWSQTLRWDHLFQVLPVTQTILAALRYLRPQFDRVAL